MWSNALARMGSRITRHRAHDLSMGPSARKRREVARGRVLGSAVRRPMARELASQAEQTGSLPTDRWQRPSPAIPSRWGRGVSRSRKADAQDVVVQSDSTSTVRLTTQVLRSTQ